VFEKSQRLHFLRNTPVRTTFPEEDLQYLPEESKTEIFEYLDSLDVDLT
jgi:hypothetical protein